ncbi:MAG: hypothetical protein UY72_C0071G0006 [Candidatus Uhrbacteria bacterium GW2011_GWD2_52_7]|uniref:Uncharacterized protein n=1 Tax=Candidatus Uhrbacteria bacterium GW2011_GWD2_52_7 TaxID=1618989 RepID=A0A0G1XC58_9BACT|nr:MAG: hypothetical protein UY72_C0071G0006 [Candidatus Uhrbacteria bacterium GW2011_GWD2_52_7]
MQRAAAAQDAYQALAWRGVRDNGEGQTGDWEAPGWLTVMPVLNADGSWTEYFGSQFDPGQYRVAAASPTATAESSNGWVDHSRGAETLEELEFVFTFLECDVWKSNLVFAFTDAGEVYRPDAYGLGSFLSGDDCPDSDAQASYSEDELERIDFLLDMQDEIDEMARERRLELGVE